MACFAVVKGPSTRGRPAMALVSRSSGLADSSRIGPNSRPSPSVDAHLPATTSRRVGFSRGRGPRTWHPPCKSRVPEGQGPPARVPVSERVLVRAPTGQPAHHGPPGRGCMRKGAGDDEDTVADRRARCLLVRQRRECERRKRWLVRRVLESHRHVRGGRRRIEMGDPARTKPAGPPVPRDILRKRGPDGQRLPRQGP